MFSKIIKKVLILHLIFTFIIIKTQNMNNVSLKNGLIGAGIAIIISIISWLLGIGYYIILGFIFGFAIIIYFLYRTGKEVRDLNGGFIDFGTLFKYTFLTYAVLSLSTSIFQYIMVNFIDTNLLENMNNTIKDFWISSIPAEGSEEAIEKMEEGFDKAPTTLSLVGALVGWLKGLILGAIIAAIISLIMRKKDPSINEFA
jgi:hypothetical protein